MFEFTSSPEMTTALTDVAIMLLSILFYVKTYKLKISKNELILWKFFFLFLSGAGLLGFIIHGIVMNSVFQDILWKIISSFFCIVVTLLFIASLIKLNSKKINKKHYILIILVSVLVYISMFIMTILKYDFLSLYIIYCGICFIIISIIYLYLYFKLKKNYSLYFIIGIFIQFIGGIVLLNQKMLFKVIWYFDYNSFYHFILLITLSLFYIGNKKYNDELINNNVLK